MKKTLRILALMWPGYLIASSNGDHCLRGGLLKELECILTTEQFLGSTTVIVDSNSSTSVGCSVTELKTFIIVSKQQSCPV
ncbi:hypothetical protein BC829DRAFT_397397 [Chytridium lagenaria]|nr:hypothetical protein BC829DRAFT_397397 [Chytridium lagenaria]